MVDILGHLLVDHVDLVRARIAHDLDRAGPVPTDLLKHYQTLVNVGS